MGRDTRHLSDAVQPSDAAATFGGRQQPHSAAHIDAYLRRNGGGCGSTAMALVTIALLLFNLQIYILSHSHQHFGGAAEAPTAVALRHRSDSTRGSSVGFSLLSNMGAAARNSLRNLRDPTAAAADDAGSAHSLSGKQQQQQLFYKHGLKPSSSSEETEARPPDDSSLDAASPRILIARPVPSPSAPQKPHPRTSQTCHAYDDESELCTYDGAICYDGTHAVTLVDTPNPFVDPLFDALNDCMDFRHYEFSSVADSGCVYGLTGGRTYHADAALQKYAHGATGTAPPLEPDDSISGFETRYWGPPNRRGLFFREIAATDVFGADPEPSPSDKRTDASDPSIAGVMELVKGAALGEDDARAVFTHESLPNLMLARRTQNALKNVTVDWLPSGAGLWLSAIAGQASSNPFHWFSQMVAPLYAAQRANATVEWGANGWDGYLTNNAGRDASQARTIHPTKTTGNRMTFRTGAQWSDVPPMSVVIAAGDGGLEVPDESALLTWYASTLKLALQRDSTVHFGSTRRTYSRNHLLCAARGAIPSIKSRLFSGPADAWLFRARGYAFASPQAAQLPVHGRNPPRTITVIDRVGQNGRFFYNRDTVLAVARETGLPVRYIPSLGRLDFKEQVELMAGTGILIAPHGAALVNAIFLPQHAVVIEIFPPLMKKFTYATLSSIVGVHHLPLYSPRMAAKSDPELAKLDGVQTLASAAFLKECVGMNVSSLDALRIPACAWTSKSYPLIVPTRRLAATLLEAVDIIGAFSKHNPAWVRALASMKEGERPADTAWNGEGDVPQLAYLRRAEALNSKMEASDW